MLTDSCLMSKGLMIVVTDLWLPMDHQRNWSMGDGSRSNGECIMIIMMNQKFGATGAITLEQHRQTNLRGGCGDKIVCPSVPWRHTEATKDNRWDHRAGFRSTGIPPWRQHQVWRVPPVVGQVLSFLVPWWIETFGGRCCGHWQVHCRHGLCDWAVARFAFGSVGSLTHFLGCQPDQGPCTLYT